GSGAGVVIESKAATGDVGFAVGRCVEALRLHCGIGYYSANQCCEAIAALESSAEALRIEVSGEVVTEGGVAVRRHPVIGKSKRPSEIGRSPSGCRVSTDLEGIASSAAETLRQ